MSNLQRFTERLHAQWLPAYCCDSERNYDPAGFDSVSLKVSEADARDCMAAIDQRVVWDTGGGRFAAPRSSANEVLFWEGRKAKSPRQITLWLEPVITFAALARLHTIYAWPKSSLGMQPKGWAFDLVAYKNEDAQNPSILGEVKKRASELHRLREDLLKLSSGADLKEITSNSAKKWAALLTMRPSVVWLVGPNEESYAYASEFNASGCMLREVSTSMLAYSAA